MSCTMLLKTRIYERMEKLIRKPGSAGKFYSKQKNILEREVAVYLESSNTIDVPSRVYGLVAPNDKHIISGGVAARAYRQVMDQDIDYVVVISTSSHTYFEEISVFNGDAYSTPLGKVEIAKDMVERIAGMHQNIIASTLGHESDEHGIEVQLPFLQHVLYDFKLIPIVMGNQDPNNIEVLTRVLSDVLANENALIVASSNFSSNHTYEKARIIDQVAVDHIKKYDTTRLDSDFQNDKVEMGSGGAVITAMHVCKNLGATTSDVMLYRNSADMDSARMQVEGYISALFYR